MAKTSPLEFLQQVRTEASKVTWPTRRETAITTTMVFIMAILAAIFFLVADMIMNWGVGLLLGLSGCRTTAERSDDTWQNAGTSCMPTRISRRR